MLSFSVLQMGQASKVLKCSHSEHIGICPQLQNKTSGGLFRHITHSSDLKVRYGLIIFYFSSSSSSISFSLLV